MNGTLIRRVMLQISADDGDTEARLDRISARADELGRKHPELKVRIDTAAASAKVAVLRQELKDLDKTADQSAGKPLLSGISAKMAGISSLIGLGLAGLPAIAAGAGALAGIALGGALLIGTKKVQGPLYSQFHDMLNTLTSVLRVAALPLVKPLGQAFAQIGQWAKAMYPEIRAVFASLGPLVAPLAKGLEGIVSGLLPGFITLMKAAAPAVQAVGGFVGSLASDLGSLLGQLAPAVRASSQVIGSLGLLLRSLMPVVGTLASSLASALAPALRSLAVVVRELAPSLSAVLRGLAQMAGAGLQVVFSAVGRVLPPLARLVTVLLTGLEPVLPQLAKSVQIMAQSIAGRLLSSLMAVLPQTDRLAALLLRLFNQVVTPNLPVITQLAMNIYQVESMGIAPLMVALPPLMGALTSLTVNVLQPMIPVLSDIASWLATIANAANAALSLLSRLPGMGGLGAASYTPAGVASIVGGSLVPPGLAGGGGASASSYATAAAAAAAAYGSNFANGVTSTAAGAARKTARQAAANLPLILAQGILAELTGTAPQVRTAISKLLGAVSTDVAGKYISEHEGTAISKWLEADQNRLVTLADRRQAILNRIHAADKYAANVTSSTESTFGLISAATSITPALGVGGIMRQLLGDVAQIRVFRNNIAKLRRMGLNKAYIDQLIQAGPVQGGQVAAELAAGNEGDIHAVNQAESAIARASRSLGRTAADAMYDSGKNAGKGFLSGLESQMKQIEAAMRKIADALVKTIKKELEISSPSQKLRRLFREVPAGAVLGIEDGGPALTAAFARMARGGAPGSGPAGYAASGRGGYLQIEWVGGGADQEFITFLKKHIRIRGGDPGVVGA